MRNSGSSVLGAAAVVIGLVGCRGSLSSEPPFHVNPNMDQQWRVDLQEPSTFFTDGRGMRANVPGTVVSGSLEATDDDQLHLHEGIKGGLYTDDYPASVGAQFGLVEGQLNGALLDRGHDRYQIYCTPCHNSTGRGDGVAVQRGYAQPQSFLEARIRAYPLGRIVNVLKHGKANMPSYADQVPVIDRWALATYVRALQIAGSAPEELVPADKRAQGQGK